MKERGRTKKLERSFATDEQETLCRIMRSYASSKGYRLKEFGLADCVRLVEKRFRSLSSIEARRRFADVAQRHMDITRIRRNNWDDAGLFLRVYFGLLEHFGWTNAEVREGVRSVMRTTSSHEEGKNSILYELLLNLPFGIITPPERDVAKVMAVLDESLYGLNQVKHQIKRVLVLANHASGMPSFPALLLCGPPGTGKTSIAEVLAYALGLPFSYLGLAGACEPPALKGFAYSWTSAQPGFFAKALAELKTSNPIILLDEIDKTGSTSAGSVTDLLTHALDSKFAHRFVDLYLNVPIDLSRVFWIATANQPARIPRHILDRCTIIEIPEYTSSERQIIIRDYFPRQIAAQYRLKMKIRVADEVASAIAAEISSLRMAKRIVADLVADELAQKSRVRTLLIACWDKSMIDTYYDPERPRPIGFRS